MSWLQRVRRSWRALPGQPAARLAYAVVLAEDGMHPSAFRQFVRAARSGLPAAQYRLGRCYLLGLGVPSSPDAALTWLTSAAEGGDHEAQALLASLAMQGISGADAGFLEAVSRYAGRPPDYREALKWGTLAAEGGLADAQAVLGYILTSGPEELRDAPGAARYFRLAAESGLAQGQLGWALALLRGDATQNEASQSGPTEVHRLLTAAAGAGLPAAHFTLGLLAEHAETGVERLAVATAHYRQAAERGHRSAQFRYGAALLNGRGVERDRQAGETWLRRAGLAGDALAAATVGNLYANQDGLPPNFSEAATWFQRAAEAGHVGSARALGQIYLHGVGFGTDPGTAVRWLRVAATADDLVAAYELGICLAHGIGTPRDDVEALQCFHRAVDAMPSARYWYARMLSEGRGTAQDLQAARTGYLLAAAEGNGDAAVAAGEMLVNGRGGPPDRPAAMALFTNWAEWGHKGAQYALKVLEPTGGPEISHRPAESLTHVAA
jgi:TPR repeat protein